MRGRSSSKTFQALSWSGHYGPHHYISHILMELGRLGLTIDETEDYGRGRNTTSVLSDLIGWLEDRGNEHHLYEWLNYNLSHLVERIATHTPRTANPRIEISAEITAMNNLSVRWHPLGWKRDFDWDHSYSGYGREKVVPKSVAQEQMREIVNRIHMPVLGGSVAADDNPRDNKVITPSFVRPAKVETEPCDFNWFSGDEGSTWNSRPSNELMYIRGVGNLDLDREYGRHAPAYTPVLNVLLICAVRAAYENLIERLERNFQVTVKTVFQFVENDDRIINWSLEDPEELKRKQDQADFEAIEKNYGFTIEKFDEELEIARQPKKGSTERPPDYYVYDRLTKNLKKAGYQITRGEVGQLHALIRRVRAAGPDREGE